MNIIYLSSLNTDIKIFAFRQIKAVCELCFYTIAKQYGFGIKELGFDLHHLHMILQLPPTLSIAKAIKLLKGISSRKLFKAFPWLRQKFFWGRKSLVRSILL